MFNTEIIYGYELRRGQKCPVTTIAVVPEMRDDQLFFGIGVAHCADSDFPVKKYGRTLATNRANGALRKHNDIVLNEFDGENATLVGMCVDWEDSHVAIQELGLPTEVTSRIDRALRFLRNNSPLNQE